MSVHGFRYLILSLLLIVASKSHAGTCVGQGSAILGLVDIEITNCHVEGKLKHEKGFLTGDFRVRLKDLTTGIKLRDKHMREDYLETDKFPDATFILDKLAVMAKNFSGSIEIRGITKPLKGKVISATKDSLNVSFDINIKDFGIKVPDYQGVVLSETFSFVVSI